MNANLTGEKPGDAVWNIPGRGARLIVDLEIIQNNVQVISANISPGTMVMAVVKAGGYGHGGAEVARAALAGGAAWLGVATVSEGIELRNAGIAAPMLVLSPTMIGEAAMALDHQLDITVGSADLAEGLCRHADERRSGNRLGVHLKINTGMNRYGVNPGDSLSAARQLAGSAHVSLGGIYTHFACADEADVLPTEHQGERFEECLHSIEREGLRPGLVHASNSAAVLRFREYDYDMVRPGICMYGVRPGAGVDVFEGMKPALRVEAQIQRVEMLEAGESVGYGGSFTATEPVRIGLLSMGYGDGYLRALSDRAWVGLAGTALPVTGRVSMDQTVVRFPERFAASAGEVVTVMGDGSNGEPTIESLAEMANTIPYEILTSLGLRLPAYHVRANSVVARNNS